MGAAPRAGLTRAPGSVPNPNRPPKNVWESNSPAPDKDDGSRI